MVKVRIALFVSLLIASTVTAQNVLVNGNFETGPPPPNNGNNLNWSVTPWVVGTGDQPNVVRVDGPGGYNYGINGPESDASAPGAGIPQHYLDVVGTNDFYQSFTPRCDGRVEFGGSFSTRANSAGTGSIAIWLGTGTAGTVVGATNVVSLPAGKSMTDPWKSVSFTVPVTGGTTYSFVVKMDNNVNFDNAFVTYTTPCEPEPCMFVKTVEDIRCNRDGTFTITTQVTNNSGNPVHYVLIAPPPGATYTVSPNVVPVSLAQGQSTNVTLTVTGAVPGQQICLTYLLQDKEGRTCCRIVECYKLPDCACLRILDPKVTCDPGPAAYAYTFTIQNMTAASIQQLFVMPSTGTVTPQLINVNLAPGGTTQVTLHLSGVSAGQTACYLLTAYGQDLKECCTIRVCVNVLRCD